MLCRVIKVPSDNATVRTASGTRLAKFTSLVGRPFHSGGKRLVMSRLTVFSGGTSEVTAHGLLVKFRKCYNHERPHESLALDVPASRYKPSPRSFPEKIPDWDYGDAITRRVGSSNCITFRKHRLRIGKGFRGQDVAVRPTSEEDAFHAYFRNSYVKTINLDQSPEHSG